MPKTIQIHNVPDDLHRNIKARAAAKGKTMSQFFVELAQAELRRPDIDALIARVRNRPIEKSGFDATAYIRQVRDSCWS